MQRSALISLTVHRSSLNEALESRSYGRRDQLSLSTSLECSIPSLLLRRGTRLCTTGLLLSGITSTSAHRMLFSGRGSHQSYLSYLLPLEAPLAYIEIELLSHLDPDGISELSFMDRILCSTLYHTYPEFKNAVIRHFNIGENRLLPAGLMTMPHVLTELQDMAIDARIFFFETICAFGPKDVLTPFIRSEAELLVPPLTSPEPFMNENTFKSLAHASIRFDTMDMLIRLLTSQFILKRSHDGYSVQNILRLWSSDTGSRERALAYFLVDSKYLDQRTEIGDDHKRVCDILIEQGYCSSRTLNSVLGVELTWVVCEAISRQKYAEPQESARERTIILSHLIHHYRPSVDTEISEFPFRRCGLKSRTLPKFFRYTPLMLAVIAGDLPVVKLLVLGGANATKPFSPKNLSALDLAVRNLDLDHPRAWVQVQPSHASAYNGYNHDYYVSEDDDITICDYLSQASNKPRCIAQGGQFEQKSSGEASPDNSVFASSCSHYHSRKHTPRASFQVW